MKTCILKFDHLPNLLLRRLYCINNEGYFVLMPIPKKDLQWPNRNKNFSEIQVLIKTHSQKLGGIY